MLLHYQADVNIQDSDGNTALHLSTSHGHEDVSTLLKDFTPSPKKKRLEDRLS